MRKLNRLTFKSNHELYIEIKKLIIEERLYKKSIEELCILIDECMHRNVKIYFDALYDAEYTFKCMENYMLGTRVCEVKRIDYMHNGELRTLLQKVGADPHYPVGDLEGGIDADIYSVFGIAQNNMLICKVEGASMKNAAINSGDTIFVDSAASPIDGNIIVARVNGNLFVKRYRLIDNNVWLISENEDYPDVLINQGMSFSVFGVVRRVLKEAF